MARKKKEITLDDNHLRQVIKEGQFFKTIFEDEIFINKIEEIQDRNYQEWLNQTTAETQTAIWMKHQALIQLLVELKVPIKLMQQAEAQLNQLDF